MSSSSNLRVIQYLDHLGDRPCPRCGGPTVERGDGLWCQSCGYYGIPCWACDGWVTDYLGIINGDHVTECPDCGKRHYAAADWWEIEDEYGRPR